MSTPIKAVEATVPARNVEKTVGNNDNKAGTPAKKVEVTDPASSPAK